MGKRDRLPKKRIRTSCPVCGAQWTTLDLGGYLGHSGDTFTITYECGTVVKIKCGGRCHG